MFFEVKFGFLEISISIKGVEMISRIITKKPRANVGVKIKNN